MSSFLQGQSPYSRVPTTGAPWDNPHTAYDSPAVATPEATATTTPGVTTEHQVPNKSYFSYDTSTAAESKNPSTGFEYSEAAGDDVNNQPERLRRFYIRALMCMFLPAAYTGYYFFIWYYYVRDEDNSRHSEKFRRGSKQHFYAWFILGVIALNLSRYGLAGAESAMLMHPWFRARNGMQLIMHCDKTWAGPSGWMKVMKKTITGQFKQLPSITWWILAFTSVIPFFAIPLSGLTFELADGYDLVQSENATVVGANQTTFDYAEFRTSAAYFNWRNSQAPIQRRRSAFYIPPDEPVPDWMKEFPNQWTKDESFTGFMAPQSTFPIAGRIWGLRIQYDCKKVTSMNDFRYLKNRNSSMTTKANEVEQTGYNFRRAKRQSKKLSAPDCLNGHPTFTNFSDVLPVPKAPECAGVETFVFNQTDSRYYNIIGFLEMAADVQLGKLPTELGSNLNSFNNESANYVEYALWQDMITMNQDTEKLLEKPLDREVQDHIPEMEGFYMYDGRPMKAIGVACESDFKYGFADVNGFRSSFENFEAAEPAPHASSHPPTKAWRAVSQMVAGKVLGVKDMPPIPDNTMNLNEHNKGVSKYHLFQADTTSSLFLQGLYKSADQSAILSSAVTDWTFMTEFLTADRMHSALIRAFKHYALQLMSASDEEWVSTARVSEEVKIITMGPVHPTVVMVLMCIWSVLSFLIAVTFAFRRKWADTLDGFTMFRFGTDFSHKKTELSVRDYEKCNELLTMPGLLGDLKPNEAVGRIGLVAGPVADKRKKYL